MRFFYVTMMPPILYLLALSTMPVLIYASSEEYDYDSSHDEDNYNDGHEYSYQYDEHSQSMARHEEPSDPDEWHYNDFDYYDDDFDSESEDDMGESYENEDHSDDYDYDNEYTAAAQSLRAVVCLPGVQFIRHPTRCDQFYQCAHGQPHAAVTCPGGLYFNTQLNVCDWPSNVDCSSQAFTYPTYQENYRGDSYSHDSMDSDDSDDDDGHYYYNHHHQSDSDEDGYYNSHHYDHNNYDDSDEDHHGNYHDSDDDDDHHYDYDYHHFYHNYDNHHHMYPPYAPMHPPYHSTKHDNYQKQPTYQNPIRWTPHKAFHLPGSTHHHSNNVFDYSPLLSGLLGHHPSHHYHYGHNRPHYHPHHHHYHGHHGGYDDSHHDNNKHYEEHAPKSDWTKHSGHKHTSYEPDKIKYVHIYHDDHDGYHHNTGHGISHDTFLPLLLMKDPDAKKLLMTSSLLSKLKALSGEGGLEELLIRQALLNLLAQAQDSGTTTTTDQTDVEGTTTGLGNIRFDAAQQLYVSVADGQPVQLINPSTNQVVLAQNTFVDPLSGAVVETATGQPLGILEPLTGVLVPAVVQTILQTQQVRRRAAQTRRGRAAGLAGSDAVNLIFLSPLTPSSLPVVAGNDARIQASLREVLGTQLADVIQRSAQVQPLGNVDRNLPNAAAGNNQFCQVVRSGETVPILLNQRAGQALTTEECSATGRLIDTFIPTFLRTFVTSDAALAGFNQTRNTRTFGAAAGINNQLNNNNNIFINPNNGRLARQNRNNVLNPINPGVQQFGTPLDNNFNNILTNRDNTNVDILVDSATNQANNRNAVLNTRLSDFIRVRNDVTGCTIEVPNVVARC